MEHLPWLAIFREVLGNAWEHPTPDIQEQRLFFVDGTHWMDTHIAKTITAQRLVRDLGTFVESRTAALSATVAHVLFSPRLREPLLDPVSSAPAWSLDHLQSLDNWETEAFCLQGHAANTPWPKPLEKGEQRQKRWRTALYEWQLYAQFESHISERLSRGPTIFPTSLETLYVTSVPEPRNKIKGDQANQWRHYLLQAEREFNDDLKRLSGVYFQQRAKAMLAILDMGYRHMVHREHRLRAKQVESQGRQSLDVYGQAFVYLDQYQDRFRSVSVYFSSPRGEALWAFLLWIHRMVLLQFEPPRFILQFDEVDIDVRLLYQNLRSYLDKQATPIDTGIFLLSMVYQTHRSLGVRDTEAVAGLAWRAFGHMTGLMPLYRAPSVTPCVPPLNLELMMMLDSEHRAEELMRHLAELGLLVTQALAWSKLKALNLTTAVIPFGVLLPATLVQVACQRQVPVPLLPIECLARARRAHWLFDYYYNVPSRIAMRQLEAALGYSCWGWTQTVVGLDQLGAVFTSMALRVNRDDKTGKCLAGVNLLEETSNIYAFSLH